MNLRRHIVLGFATALAGVAAPRAQTAAGQVRRVAQFGMGSRLGVIQVSKPFYEEMARFGWVEGRNFVHDVAAADGQIAMLPRLAAELVARGPHVITVGSPTTARAAMQATTTIPILFWDIATPVEAGLVSSLAHPGGNVTGVSASFERLLPKRVQLLHDILPKLKRVGMLRPPVDPVLDKVLAQLEPTLSQLGVTILGADVSEATDIEPAVSRLASAHVEAIVDAVTSAVIYLNRGRLIELTNRARLPWVANWDAGADAGALFSYGQSQVSQTRAFARLVDRVLRGANPADTPVEAIDEFDFVVNLQAARLFGISVPQSMLISATRVIE
jgi:putative ABC transport system substrate-binding protein